MEERPRGAESAAELGRGEGGRDEGWLGHPAAEGLGWGAIGFVLGRRNEIGRVYYERGCRDE